MYYLHVSFLYSSEVCSLSNKRKFNDIADKETNDNQKQNIAKEAYTNKQ